MATSFLSRIDGKVGETLATAVLGALLETSRPLAITFCAMLSKKFNKTIVAADLKAEFEQCTDDNGEKGRIDLLITTQNFAIGIECKILHFLGDKQTEKYRKDVAAKSLDYLLLVLVPKSRETQARAAWERQDAHANHFLITWEDLIRELIETEGASSECRFLASDLSRFINDYVGALDSFESDYDEIFGAHSEQRNREQYLYALKPFFGFDAQVPIQGASPGKWKGYTFVKTACGIEGWYGFVRTTQLPNIAHPAGVEWQLVVGLSTGALRERQLNLNEIFAVCNKVEGWNNDWWKTWIVTPDKASFVNESQWQSALQPIISAVDAAIASIPPTKGLVPSVAVAGIV